MVPHELVQEFSGAKQICDGPIVGGLGPTGARGTSVGLRHCEASVGRRVWLPHELVEEVSGAGQISDGLVAGGIPKELIGGIGGAEALRCFSWEEGFARTRACGGSQWG